MRFIEMNSIRYPLIVSIHKPRAGRVAMHRRPHTVSSLFRRDITGLSLGRPLNAALDQLQRGLAVDLLQQFLKVAHPRFPAHRGNLVQHNATPTFCAHWHGHSPCPD